METAKIWCSPAFVDWKPPASFADRPLLAVIDFIAFAYEIKPEDIRNNKKTSQVVDWAKCVAEYIMIKDVTKSSGVIVSYIPKSIRRKMTGNSDSDLFEEFLSQDEELREEVEKLQKHFEKVMPNVKIE